MDLSDLPDPPPRCLEDISVSKDIGVRMETLPSFTLADAPLQSFCDISVATESGVINSTGLCLVSPTAGDDLCRAGVGELSTEGRRALSDRRALSGCLMRGDESRPEARSGGEVEE
mmetsp:Transcript_77378/g.173198  ORF Transcript_77378/g.173198 Transcript_77378/m.173198 type:complete len:116 (-) Transcript_77378:75-422(-)